MSDSGAQAPAPLLLRSALVITGDAADTRHERADILLRGGRIAAITAANARPEMHDGPDTRTEIVDASGWIALPGLVNAHVHSNEAFEQGAWDKFALECWLPRAYPAAAVPGLGPLPSRWHYLRAMMTAALSIRSGVTTLQDDFLNPRCDAAALDQTLEAYRDAGLRAQVALTFADGGYLDGLPFARQVFPADLQASIDAQQPTPVERQFEHAMDALARWHGKAGGRLRLALGPRGPQRCSRALLERLAALSAERGLALHMHVLETRTQAVTAKLQHGVSYIEYLERCGMLSPRLTLNHAIWLTDADIARLGAAGCSSTHNPLSNMKLGSGRSPVRALLDGGVNVALGSDGATTSDTIDFVESLRAASLAHTLDDIEPERWVGAREAFAMATRGGARSVLQETQIGSLEPGKRADLVLLDRGHWNFLPLADPLRQLAYSASSAAIDSVIIEGRFIMRSRRILSFDEAALRGEVAQAAERYRREWLVPMARAAEALDPYLRAVLARARAETLDPEPCRGVQNCGGRIA